MNNYVKLAIVAIVAFGAGKYLFPPKPEVKEVIKTVEVEKWKEKRIIVTKVKEVKKPDGTVITETDSVEDTQSTKDTNLSTVSEKTTKSGSKLTLGVLAIKQADKFSETTQFGATITVPLLGNIKAQALGATDKRVGLGLALDF